MKSYLLSAAAVLLLSAGGGAQAATLTFDNSTGPAAVYTEAGMTITATATSADQVRTAGTWFLSCCAGGTDQFDLTTGGLFDLLSIDIVHSDSGDPILFEGFLGASLIASTSVNASNFGNLVFAGFTGLDRVRITASGTFTDASFDNLTYQDAPAVPEPGTISLFLGGLALAAFAKRKRAGGAV